MKPETAALLGQQVGNIRVVDVLGEGGMGAVYVGFDDKLQRKVALKAIRSEYRLHEEAKARFLREARILSQLDHPNVCTVHEFIEGDDCDFLVLELVQGKSLRAAMKDELDKGEKLSIAKQLLEVLVAVHSQGVIHRDLKPENVMITTDGGIKVLDFGLSRSAEAEGATSATALTVGLDEAQVGTDPDPTVAPSKGSRSAYVKTKLGTVIGTVGYMSPEQARGEPATAASDMYSLGLILQEMFTGTRPFEEGLGAQELLRRAAEGATLPITGLSAGLTALIGRFKSLAPGARPSSVDALAALEWIIDAPRRRRRRAIVAAVWAALMLLTLGMTVQTIRAGHEAERANREMDQAEELAAFLIDLFQVSDPDVAQGQPIDARELLEAGAERIERELDTQPLRQAKLMFTIARIDHRIGSWDEAEKLYRQALALQEGHLPAGDPQTVATMRALGDLLVDRAEIERGEALLLRALALVDERSEADRLERARTLASYGRLLYRGGRLEEGVEKLQEAIRILDDELGSESAELLEPLYDLAGALIYQARCGDAEPVLERHQMLTRSLNQNLTVATARLLMAQASCLSTQDPAAAAVLSQRAIEAFTQLLGAEHAYVGDSRLNLGVVYRRLGQFDLAEQEQRRAIEILRATRGEEHSHTANAIGELGLLHWQRGELEAAAIELQRSLRILRRTLAPGHPWIGWSLWALGNVYRDQGRLDQGEQCYLEALAIQEASLPAHHPELRDTLSDYARLLRTTGRDAEAEELEARAKGGEERGADSN